MKKDGGPAFPYTPSRDSIFHEPPMASGMSLRDYFAAKALNGILSDSRAMENRANLYHDNESMVAALAAHSYELSDAMLAEREK